MEKKYRGIIITEILEIEFILKRIIYNFYFPKSEDKKTRILFLNNFIDNQTFGGLKEGFYKIIKTNRFKKIYELSNKKNNDVILFDSYIQELKNNLNEFNVLRNFVAHGMNITGAFFTLEEEDLMIINNLNLKKINNDFFIDFDLKIERTKYLLDITNGFIKDN